MGCLNEPSITYRKVEMNSGLIICLKFEMHVQRHCFAYKIGVHTKFDTEEPSTLRVYATRTESYDFASSVHSVSIDVGSIRSIVKLYVLMNSPLKIREKNWTELAFAKGSGTVIKDREKH